MNVADQKGSDPSSVCVSVKRQSILVNNLLKLPHKFPYFPYLTQLHHKRMLFPPCLFFPAFSVLITQAVSFIPPFPCFSLLHKVAELASHSLCPHTFCLHVGSLLGASERLVSLRFMTERRRAPSRIF